LEIGARVEEKKKIKKKKKRKKEVNVNKNPTTCNSMQIFIYCKVTLHVSGVTAPIIRSTKTVTAASGTATSLQRGRSGHVGGK